MQNQIDVKDSSSYHHSIGNSSVIRTDGQVARNNNLDLYLDKHKLHLLLPKIDRI